MAMNYSYAHFCVIASYSLYNDISQTNFNFAERRMRKTQGMDQLVVPQCNCQS